MSQFVSGLAARSGTAKLDDTLSERRALPLEYATVSLAAKEVATAALVLVFSTTVTSVTYDLV